MSLADTQAEIRYWKEETLCRFLCIPDSIGPNPGPVIYQMTTYLGAFPFPSLAPSILTFEALLKVVVIMTEKYTKVLKGGKTDRNKLLFRSLAVFDRRMSSVHEPPSKDSLGFLKAEYEKALENDVEGVRSHVAGFSVDEPGSYEDEEEDDDELALAALDSLDAIEVFKSEHQTIETKIHRAQIPIDYFRRLITLLLIIAPLDAQESLASHTEHYRGSESKSLELVAASITSSFIVEGNTGISYSTFNSQLPSALPYLFEGLNPLFEHFLFSKNFDLSRKKPSSPSSPIKQTILPVSEPEREPLLPAPGEILDLSALSQLSFFISGTRLFRRLRPLYSGVDSGFSIGSFEQRVLNWRAPSILLVSGHHLPLEPADNRQRAFADTLPTKRFADKPVISNTPHARIVYGAFMNVPWRQTHKEAIGDAETILFQLQPIHQVFRASTLVRDYVTFTPSGLAFGNPPAHKTAATSSSHASQHARKVALGPVSLTLDSSLEFGVFNHDAAGGGSFHTGSAHKDTSWQDRFEIESLEVWGCGGSEEAEIQRKAWEFENREAAARRGVKLGKDVEADRALLEMAGLVGGHGNSGGSMA